MGRHLPIKYWEERCDHLFRKADAMGDTLSSDIKVFLRQRRMYEEAALIFMMLNTYEAVIDKLAKEVRELRYILARTPEQYKPEEY